MCYFALLLRLQQRKLANRFWGEEKQLHVIYALFIFFLLIGKNSWIQQPGTFVIMSPLLPITVSGQRVQLCMAWGPWAVVLVMG